LKVGCLVNLETRKGAPAKIIPGESLPEYRPALPDIDVIMPLYLPETVCTIEPPSSARICAESEGAVHTPLCTAIEPLLNPGDGSTTVQRGSMGLLNRSEGDFESENVPEEATVQRFNADQEDEEIHTRSPLVRAALEMGAVLVDLDADDLDALDAEVDALATEVTT
jgi:hypothetical protein